MTEEYAIRVDVEHPLRRYEPVGTIITHWGNEKALHAPKIWHGWTLLRRLAGPWVEVGSTPEESREDHE